MSKEMLRMYKKGKTLQEIANHYGMTRQAVHQKLTALNYEPRKYINWHRPCRDNGVSFSFTLSNNLLHVRDFIKKKYKAKGTMIDNRGIVEILFKEYAKKHKL